MWTRLVALLSAALIAMGVAVPAAVTAPTDVIADYFVDGQLTGTYSVTDLRGALAFAQTRLGAGAQYSAFADIVSEALTERLAGTSGDTAEGQLKAQKPNARTQTTPKPDPAATVPAAPDEGLPAPPPADPNDELPTAVPVMGFVALGLVAVGSLSAIWRRRRR